MVGRIGGVMCLRSFLDSTTAFSLLQLGLMRQVVSFLTTTMTQTRKRRYLERLQARSLCSILYFMLILCRYSNVAYSKLVVFRLIVISSYNLYQNVFVCVIQRTASSAYNDENGGYSDRYVLVRAVSMCHCVCQKQSLC